MGKIVLLSCASKKKSCETNARDLYVSPLFKKSLQYAFSLRPASIFILSAKHGLLHLDDRIAPYDLTLNQLSVGERKKWATEVVDKLRTVANLATDEFIFLAGTKYREYLLPHLSHYSLPLAGLGIGKQLKWLTDKQ